MIRYLAKSFIFRHPEKILILAPHPDDEILGLGGLLTGSISQGCKIHIVYLTDGEGSAIWPDKEEIRRNRIMLSGIVCAKLGLLTESITRLHIPDGSVPDRGQPGFDSAVLEIREIIDSERPDAVFATHTLDHWPYDHAACAHIAYDAVQQSVTKPRLWYYWVWAWYNLRPWKLSSGRFRRLRKVDISDQLLRKKELMNIYLKACTPDGRPWSGVLPPSLLKAFRLPVEIIEEIAVPS